MQLNKQELKSIFIKKRRKLFDLSTYLFDTKIDFYDLKKPAFYVSYVNKNLLK